MEPMAPMVLTAQMVLVLLARYGLSIVRREEASVAGSDSAWWSFLFFDGREERNSKGSEIHAMAVHDVAPVPEPTTMLLLGSGLIGLLGFRRRFRG